MNSPQSSVSNGSPPNSPNGHGSVNGEHVNGKKITDTGPAGEKSTSSSIAPAPTGSMHSNRRSHTAAPASAILLDKNSLLNMSSKAYEDYMSNLGTTRSLSKTDHKQLKAQRR